ncbi:MAG: YbfB/YjiJ family MFS transporter [Leptolyngbya sp. UWPOB_LEPTO1]|nr:YbfB/YjiJ family MFS transporter [Leptolyngbya sp. UWPOB_LEPTO1]
MIALYTSSHQVKSFYRSDFWFAGLAATFTGNGIGRFAYITLMPVLIQAHWFSQEEAAQLGVAALLGYLLGPFLIQRFGSLVRRATLMRIAMLLCASSYFACAFPQMGFGWFYTWRFLSGVGGAVLMILAAPMVLPHIRQDRRSRVAGVIFSGIGLGAALSGLLIPVLVQIHVKVAWVAMGLACAGLTLMTWKTWAELDSSPNSSAATPPVVKSHLMNWGIGYLLIAYALNAVGFLPHTLFWVDFLVRDLGFSLASGGLSWALFGIGAAVGPLLTGVMGDRLGVRRCLVLGFGLKALGVMIPLVTQKLWMLHCSAFLVGMFTPGIVTLVSTYCLQLVGTQEHHRAWGAMTFSFALTQAIAGMGMAILLRQVSSYLPLYAISAIALVISTVCILCIPQPASIRAPESI